MRHVHNVNCQDSAEAQVERQLREIDNLNYNQAKAAGITAIDGGRLESGMSVSNSFGWQRVRLEFMDAVQPNATCLVVTLNTCQPLAMATAMASILATDNCKEVRPTVGFIDSLEKGSLLN